MKPYIESKTSEGVHLINPQAILEKIKLAARVIVTIENPEEVIVFKSDNEGGICETLRSKSSVQIRLIYRLHFLLIISMDPRNIHKSKH